MSLDKEKKFEAVFRAHYQELHYYVFKLLEDADAAEEVVQQVFLRLWEKDWEREVHSSLRAYLYKAVYHEGLNILQRERVKERYRAHVEHQGAAVTVLDRGDGELREQLRLALELLPEKTRTVFELSRFQELKYQEIATLLGLSVKTVEGHMSKALRHLRIHLVEYLTVLLWTLIA